MSKDLPITIPSCGKPAGRPKASDLEARTAHLIHTAGHLFIEHGFAKTSLEMIAREAHVAVRTIYVKFGGKRGLLEAVLMAKRDRFFTQHDFEADARPLRTVLREFATHFLQLVSAPDAVRMQRQVIAEATDSPELAQTFYDAGPKQTRIMLAAFFDRPDIRAQLRPSVPSDVAAVHLLNCIIGDQFVRFLFDAESLPLAQIERDLDIRIQLFFDSVLLPE